jgi:hypothetical protein
MLTAILPVISLSVSLARPVSGASDEVVSTPRAAQVRLAEVLADADAVYGVGEVGPTRQLRRARHTIAFAIDQGGVALRATATTRASGEVISLTITTVGPALGDLGSLTWLADELAHTTAVTRLAVDEDGAVTITTDDDRSYMAIPGRGSGGNIGVSARWAAAWDANES